MIVIITISTIAFEQDPDQASVEILGNSDGQCVECHIPKVNQLCFNETCMLVFSLAYGIRSF